MSHPNCDKTDSGTKFPDLQSAFLLQFQGQGEGGAGWFSFSFGRRLLLQEGSQICLVIGEWHGVRGTAGSAASCRPRATVPFWLQDCVLSGGSQPQLHLPSQKSWTWGLLQGGLGANI